MGAPVSAPTQLCGIDAGTAREHAPSPLRAAGSATRLARERLHRRRPSQAARLESLPAQAGAKVAAKAPSSYRSTAARHAGQPSPRRTRSAAQGAHRSEWQHGRSRVPRGAAMHTTHSPRPSHAPPSPGTAPHSRSSSASACAHCGVSQLRGSECAHVHVRAYANLGKRRPPVAGGAHAPLRECPEAPRRRAPPGQRGPARRGVGDRLSLIRQAGAHARVEVGGALRGVDGGRAGEELEQDDAEGEDVRRGQVLACRASRVTRSRTPTRAARTPVPACAPALSARFLRTCLLPIQRRSEPAVALGHGVFRPASACAALFEVAQRSAGRWPDADTQAMGPRRCTGRAANQRELGWQCPSYKEKPRECIKMI